MELAEGELISPDQEVLTIADLKTVWVQADVYERDIGAIRSGQEAQLSVTAFPDAVFRGRVTYISDVLDPKTRTAKVRIEVPNSANRLKLGMFASVELPAAGETQTATVPKGAVQKVEGETVVFVKTGANTFQKRAVKLGQELRDAFEVLKGLSPEEQVVVEGSVSLKAQLMKDELGEHHDD